MQFKKYLNKKTLALITVFLLFIVFLPKGTQAQSVTELQNQIDSYAKRIAEIDREIEAQRLKVQNTSTKASDLQSTVNSLNASKKKLETDITKTRAVIDKSSVTIKKISLEIDEKKDLIHLSNEALKESIRSLNILDQRSFFEMLFSGGSISAFTNDLAQLDSVKEHLKNRKKELVGLNLELGEKKTEEELEMERLENETKKLAGQKESVEYTKKEKDSLLATTKNEEQSYRQLLAKKEAEKKEFEDTLLEIESKLHLLIDPNSYPGAKKGVVSWPVSVVRVTQQFGGTQFAKTNPSVYSRPFHPGMDFGVPIGTEVKSIADGVIMGWDNTDAYAGCRSWGRWVMVKHDNGLTSLYAHLSSVIKTKGERVNAGDTIALSGNTGISTGPHLHLGLYASQGIFIDKFKNQKKSATGCAATEASGPFADLDAYLDPGQYLPSL